MSQDAIEPTHLTERQEKILALVVREYINKPEPVGSKYLADNFLTNISSATIRNDLAALEELGYVTAPHTSAGRVPTEAGYRYFVKRLLDEGELPAEEQKSIANEFSQAPNEIEQWMRGGDVKQSIGLSVGDVLSTSRQQTIAIVSENWA